MKPVLKFAACILLSEAIFYISCQKKFNCEDCKEENKPPIAHAGKDTVIVLPVDSVMLDGRASTYPENNITGYEWRKISGPIAFTIKDASAASTLVKNIISGAYEFELMVTDNAGLSAKDTIRITVDSALITNHPPIAKAGNDTTIILSANTITLDGSASSDPENNIASYLWTKISGPASLNIVNANVMQATVTNLVEGVYQFELKVTDAGGLFAKDTMQVMINNTIQTTCPFQQTLIGTLYPYRYGVQTATAGNKIVFAGGWETPPGLGSVASAKVDIYDVLTQIWSSFNLTNHGGHVATIAAGNKIFFAGGTSINPNVDASSEVDIYNTTDNTWATAQLSEARNGISAAKVGNMVLFAGGSNSSGPSTKVDIYELSTSSWSTANLSQTTIFGNHTVALGDKAIFQVGTGVDIYNASTDAWSTYGFGGGYFDLSTAISENKIYLAGGYDGNKFSDVVRIYDVVSNTWSSTKMSQPKAAMASIGAGSKIFWAGGFDSTWANGTEDYVRSVEDIETYDVNTGKQTHHFMAAETYGSLGVANNHVLFWSGFDDLHIYNTNSDTWTNCKTELGWGPVSISIGNTTYVAGPVGAQATSISVWKLEF